jgi:hypothetical protein
VHHAEFYLIVHMWIIKTNVSLILMDKWNLTSKLEAKFMRMEERKKYCSISNNIITKIILSHEGMNKVHI